MVRGISPTISGVYLLPLMAGLLIVSIGSGQFIARTGKYRVFPIAGTALMTIGLFLLHLMSPSSSTFADALYMLVLGMGLGGVMQVLVIIVQNGVPHSELGVATSGATFFRSIGGSFGTAIFGAIFSNVLISNLSNHLHGLSLPAGFTSSDVTPAALGHLSATVRAGFVSGYAESIQTVFLIAVPIALLAFLASWLIPQVELRSWAPAASAAPTAEGRRRGRGRRIRPGRDPGRWTASTARRCRRSRSIRRTPAAATAAGETTRANSKPAARPARRARLALIRRRIHAPVLEKDLSSERGRGFSGRPAAPPG